ncbi:hypothetical protein KAFR_0C01290 [Kazachstania africana CBS 2517]|uniref:Phosphate metabolism protein 7 n=1 Tax=Kazachstania africana (strain ATCC 22294 / BCRC 22015 / CBS 2517 / CECT 1963 / NBRC 1671 / NRRL Y-8276) TaxID=1071382 RepID=H2ARX2_KAZAF|nr:hypothetical protein KAFR_0C01290 [Kazachstania africana CBS 2517]CCF57122.1 hypothetical protein KAFR_0C01290 [Kazachstania africana CBS 2517]
MAADTSSSTSAFVTTLIFNLIVGGIFLLLFVLFRQREKRVYQPRTLTDVQTLPEEQRIDTIPPSKNKFFDWIPYILTKPHSFVIQHAGVDGYFYLRYMGIFITSTVIIMCLVLPILLPVNATNGNNLKGFEILSFANVKNKNRFYAHVFLSWIVFLFLIYVIYKELYYYVVFRHAMQTSPLYDGLISSRTVILTELKDEFNEGEFKNEFPESSSITFAYDLSDLDDTCKERSKNSQKLEKALNKVINKSVKKRKKAEKKGKLDKLYDDGKKPQDDLETYVPFKKRPHHRTGPWYFPPIYPIFHRKKVNTIQHCSHEIVDLNEKVADLQKNYKDNTRLRTVFVQFENQIDAQKCYQTLAGNDLSDAFGKRFICSAPDDIIWDNVNITTGRRRIRRILGNTFLTLMIIFWAIPVAVVGCISNINFLTQKIPFLRWINNLPNVLMGLITGLLPTILLAILMSLVAPIITKVGKLSGCITYQQNSKFIQRWYFAFQVIQVFIVTTLASSAAATVEAIINDPSSAMTLLANNLPKASNFYIFYFLLLALTTPTSNLLQAVTLVLAKLTPFLDSTPRAKWLRYNKLSQPNYSVLYPTVQILAIIEICYMIIAPILMIFSTLAFVLTYIATLYNILFVMAPSDHDNRGRNYPWALFQIFVGIYLSEVCLLGLFIMAKSWGPLVLEVVILVATAFLHIFLKWRFNTLIDHDFVPLSAIHLSRGELRYLYPQDDLGLGEINELAKSTKQGFENDETGGVIRIATERELEHAGILPNEEETGDNDMDTKTNVEEQRKLSSFTGTTMSSNGVSTFINEDGRFRKFSYTDVERLRSEYGYRDQESNGGDRLGPEGAIVTNADYGNIVYSDPNAVTNDTSAFPRNINRNVVKQRIVNFFSPKKSYPFASMRRRLPHAFNTVVEYDPTYMLNAYTDPFVFEHKPIIWICKDPMGVSKKEINELKVIGADVRDDFTEYDDKGRPIFTFNPPDYENPAKK